LISPRFFHATETRSSHHQFSSDQKQASALAAICQRWQQTANKVGFSAQKHHYFLPRSVDVPSRTITKCGMRSMGLQQQQPGES
jgi:hypothetical protein